MGLLTVPMLTVSIESGSMWVLGYVDWAPSCEGWSLVTATVSRPWGAFRRAKEFHAKLLQVIDLHLAATAFL